MPEEAIELVDSNTSLAEVDTAMESFDKAMEGVVRPGVETRSVAAPAPLPKEEAKTEAVSDIPEELRGLNGTAATPKEKEPDFDSLMKETPQGQIKHSHYKTLQTAADAKIKGLQTELSKALQAIEEAQKRGVSEEHAKQLEELKTKLSERDAILERRFYEDSEAFKVRFGSKDAQINGQLEQAAKDYEIPDARLAALKHANGKQRLELLREMDLDETAKADVATLLRQRDMHESEKKAALDNAHEGLSQYATAEQQRRAEAEKKQIEEDNRTFESVKSHVLKSVGAFHIFADDESFNASGLKELAGVSSRAEWEKAVNERMSEASKLYNYQDVTSAKQAEAAFKAAAYDFLFTINKGLRAELTASRQLNGKLSAATPGNGQPTSTKADTSSLTPEQHAENTWDTVVAPVIRR